MCRSPVPRQTEHVVREDVGEQAEPQERHHAHPRYVPNRELGQGGCWKRFRRASTVAAAVLRPHRSVDALVDSVATVIFGDHRWFNERREGQGRRESGPGEGGGYFKLGKGVTTKRE